MKDFTLGGASSSASALLTSAKGLQHKKLESEANVEKAASGFESIMLRELLKSMLATTGQTSGLFGEDSFQSQMYRDMFNESLADEISRGKGIGIKGYVKSELEHKKG